MPMMSEVRPRVVWPRVLACGLLAGIVWIALGSVVTALLGREFAALPNNRLGAPTAGFVVFNAVLDLLEGISMVWLYAVLRPLYGPGPKPLSSQPWRGGSSSAWETPRGVPSECFPRTPSCH
jgi:hypothetical protein